MNNPSQCSALLRSNNNSKKNNNKKDWNIETWHGVDKKNNQNTENVWIYLQCSLEIFSYDCYARA